MYYFSTTKTGYTHISNNKRRDDAAVCRRLTDNILYVAVSDGAGSASLSSIGAYTVTDGLATVLSDREILKKYLPEKLSRLSLDEILNTLLKKENEKHFKKLINTIIHTLISQLCCDSNLPHNIFSATLVCCFVKDEKEIIALHIGDGFICVYDKTKKSASFLSKPDNIGEMLNQTYFATSSDAFSHTRITYYNKDFDGILISSDGLNRIWDDAYLTENLVPALVNEDINEDFDLYNRLFSDYDQQYPSAVTDDCSVILLIREQDTSSEYDGSANQTNNKTSLQEHNTEFARFIKSLSLNINSDIDADKLQHILSPDKGSLFINNLNIYLKKPGIFERKRAKFLNKKHRNDKKKGSESDYETVNNLQDTSKGLSKNGKRYKE